MRPTSVETQLGCNANAVQYALGFAQSSTPPPFPSPISHGNDTTTVGKTHRMPLCLYKLNLCANVPAVKLIAIFHKHCRQEKF